MKRVLALDLSTKPGWAVMEETSDGTLPTLIAHGTNFKIKKTELNPDYITDFHLLDKADLVAGFVLELLNTWKPDETWVEQTNGSSFRTSQKQLEFIHCAFLVMMRELGLAKRVNYVDTSQWRKGMNIRMTKEQKLHNKAVKKKQAKGKITPKHLAVEWVNKNYGLNLLLKDEDAAEGILMGAYGLTHPRKTAKITDEILNDALK